ncbi:MAG: tRNA guanosine(34) transglycosylase Tgt [Elusimicrobiota bacterium]
MNKNIFEITHKLPNSKARAGILETGHATIETPVFMPVGTQACIKTVGTHEMNEMVCNIMLANTYHIFLRPGEEVLKAAGGLHKFMSWNKSILTDSGGFQVFSLANRCTLSEKGVEFQSHVDGQMRFLSPEITTQFQLDIGSDIAMCLDECPAYPALEADARKSMDLTLRWAERCKKTYEVWLEEHKSQWSPRGVPPLVFGITQGACFPEMRKESAEKTVEIGFPGYAIGGLGVGESKEEMWQFLEGSLAGIPENSPRYLMGIGQPEDMWGAVERGVDMFDCVLPSRNGRNGQAFSYKGRYNITNSIFRSDFGPLDEGCQCVACKNYSRAYLFHLFKAGELLAPRLITLHNLYFMLDLMKKIRTSILNGNFESAKKEFFSTYEQK